MDWRETMQRMLVRMEEAGQWPAVCEEARAVLEAENEPSREPAAYLWGGLVPPDPTCAKCGAVAARAYGPVIPMRSPQSVEFLGSGAFQDNVHVDLIRKFKELR